MKKPLSLKDRLLAKLVKLGLSERKAKELAPGLVVTASKAPVKGTVTEKLTTRLVKLGLTERKATELAKGLAPMVRSAITAKAKARQVKVKDVSDEMVEEAVAESVDSAEDLELDKVAPRVNGHRVRLDLPVAPMAGIRGIELLRVMDGLSSRQSYLVAAVKSDVGIVAVRKLGEDLFNVKFYPDMAYWERNETGLTELGAHAHLKREWYERMHFNREVLTALLAQLAQEGKPKSRIKAVLDRFLSVTATPLLKAFGYLHPIEGGASHSAYASH
jgi:hypothetical protein